MNGFLHRLAALLKKERKQLLRDKSNMIIGIIIPLMLIFIMGYGLSMDVKNMRTAVVMEDSSPDARSLTSFLVRSEYFLPTYVTSLKEAQELVIKREADAIIHFDPDFTKNLYQGTVDVQVIVSGLEMNSAAMKNNLQSGISLWAEKNAEKYLGEAVRQKGKIALEPQIRFNNANTSTWYLIPGLIVTIVSLVGVFMTSLVMAKEWEKGTLESIFVTPVQILEIVLSKMIPYYFVALIGLLVCLFVSHVIFDVPMQGSLLLIILTSTIYLFVMLGMGLTISSLTKNRFISCQVALTVSLLPTVMLSGFLYDLNSTPYVVNIIGHLLPATYYLEIIKNLFLAGNNWAVVIKNSLILVLYAVFFVALSFRVTKKSVE